MIGDSLIAKRCIPPPGAGSEMTVSDGPTTARLRSPT